MDSTLGETPGSWFNGNLAGLNPSSHLLALTIFTSLFQPANPNATTYIASSIVVLFLGALLETGRRFFSWIYERFDLFREPIGFLLFFCLHVEGLMT
jgi:hypothetical protein